MIQYSELVQYIKDNHINWNTDLFDVLKGFFENRNQITLPSIHNNVQAKLNIKPQDFFKQEPFKEPDDGEYKDQDLYNLFNT